jgi:hypothetical protein
LSFFIIGQCPPGSHSGSGKDLGQTLLSFSCHNIAPAVIDDEALSKISDLEKKLGVVLLAVS